MRKEARMLLVFALNLLLPGLGFHYSGTKHNLQWPRRVGLVTMVVFLFVFPLGIVFFVPYARIGYHFTFLELSAYVTVILCSAFVGAGVEQRISQRQEKS